MEPIITLPAGLSRRGEIMRKFVHRLGSRRSQVSNWLIRIFGPNDPFVGRFLDGFIEVHLDDPASRAAYFCGVYERETTIWLKRFLQTNSQAIIFDVGANFGYFSLSCANFSKGTAVVHSFEPDPNTYCWLQRNAVFNPNFSITTNKMAVSSSSGTVSFLSAAPDAGRSLWSRIPINTEVKKAEHESEISVPSISLDDYCEQHKIKSVDLVKIDIEGAEGMAILGMKKGLKQGIYKNILLELHNWALPKDQSPQWVVNQIVSEGYTPYKFKQTHTDENIDKLKGVYCLDSSEEVLSPDVSLDNLTTWEHILFVRN